MKRINSSEVREALKKPFDENMLVVDIIGEAFLYKLRDNRDIYGFSKMSLSLRKAYLEMKHDEYMDYLRLGKYSLKSLLKEINARRIPLIFINEIIDNVNRTAKELKEVARCFHKYDDNLPWLERIFSDDLTEEELENICRIAIFHEFIIYCLIINKEVFTHRMYFIVLKYETAAQEFPVIWDLFSYPTTVLDLDVKKMELFNRDTDEEKRDIRLCLLQDKNKPHRCIGKKCKYDSLNDYPTSAILLALFKRKIHPSENHHFCLTVGFLSDDYVEIPKWDNGYGYRYLNNTLKKEIAYITGICKKNNIYGGVIDMIIEYILC